MRAVAYAIAGPRHVEEVVQDAWLAAVRALDGFEGRSSLKTWLLTIAANTARTRASQARREVLLDDLPAPMAASMTPASPLTAIGCAHPAPGTRTRRKPCCRPTSCASAWRRPC